MFPYYVNHVPVSLAKLHEYDTDSDRYDSMLDLWQPVPHMIIILIHHISDLCVRNYFLFQ